MKSMKSKLSWLGVLLGTIGISLLAVGFFAFRWVRFEAIEEIVSRTGTGTAPWEERVDALLALALSEDAPLQERNRAIWALGELGRDRVLPDLRELDRFDSCDHANRICVRELRKAIQKLSR